MITAALKVALHDLLIKSRPRPEMASCETPFDKKLGLNELIVAHRVERREEDGGMESVVCTEEFVFCS